MTDPVNKHATPVNPAPACASSPITLEREFAASRRELPRLLAEGHAGRYAVIHGDQLVSLWDTYRDANQAG